MFDAIICKYLTYNTQYQGSIHEVGEAQQLLCSMISSDVIYEQRPVNEPTVTEILEFMLQKEIQATADLGAYSGECKCCVPVINEGMTVHRLGCL